VTRSFADAVRSGEFVVTVQCWPPRGADLDGLNACADALGGIVNAIGVAECEDGVRMSALAACGHLIAAGIDPILHLLTRDMNRIALQSALLGAASMGVRSVLCTTGRHQALTTSSSARGVFDVDPIQLLRIADAMRKTGELADGAKIDGELDLLLGTDTNPFCDPVELQVMAMGKAVEAGADFVVTQPVFVPGDFEAWMKLVRERELHERTCVIASVMPLTSAQQALDLADRYTHLHIPADVIDRLQHAPDPRACGVGEAADLANELRGMDGVRGICVTCGEDYGLARDVISSSEIAGT